MTPRAGVTSRCSRVAAVTLALAACCGCAEISLREAMDRVQRRHDALQRSLESGSSFGSRDAATELELALEAPAVSSQSPFAREPEYERLLEEAIASTRRVRQVAQKFDRDALAKLRTEVSSRCDACHKVFRHP